MEIQIESELLLIKGGVLARSPALRLAAVRESAAAAITRLEEVVAAYCRVLSREGWLEQAMARAGVEMKDVGGEGLVIKVAA